MHDEVDAIGPVETNVPAGYPSDVDQNDVIDEENAAQDRMMANYRRSIQADLIIE